jgi:hypothetical protein
VAKRADAEGKCRLTTEEEEDVVDVVLLVLLLVARSSIALLLLNEEIGPQKEASFAIAGAERGIRVWETEEPSSSSSPSRLPRS